VIGRETIHLTYFVVVSSDDWLASKLCAVSHLFCCCCCVLLSLLLLLLLLTLALLFLAVAV
jgi:hypothetical protein